MWTRSRTIWVIVTIAAASRLLCVLGIAPMLWPDSLLYYKTAQIFLQSGSLAAHRSFHTPLYPMFLAAHFYLFDESPLAGEMVIISQHLLGIICTVLIFLLGERLFNRKVGTLAGLFFAVHPLQLFYESSVLTEPLFIFFFLVSLLLLFYFIDRPSPPRALLVCTALVAAILTRPLAQALPVIVAAYVAWRIRPVREGRRYSLFVLIACYLLLLPWMYYNLQTHHFFAISKGGGLNLFYRVFEVEEMRPRLHGKSQAKMFRHFSNLSSEFHGEAYLLLFDQRSNLVGPGVADQEMFDMALGAIKRAPARFLALSAREFLQFFFEARRSPRYCATDRPYPYACVIHTLGVSCRAFPNIPRDLLRVRLLAADALRLLTFPFWIVSGLALVGAGAALLQRRCVPEILFLLGTISFFSAMTAMFNIAEDRYRLPYDGIFFIFAAYAITYIYSTLFTSRSCPTTPPAANPCEPNRGAAQNLTP